MQDPLWGIDIGGTKIGVCVGSSSGQLRAHAESPTTAHATPEEALSEALLRLESMSRQHGLAPIPSAVGVACPGPFDRRTRSFLDVPNMRGWQGFRLGDFLDNRLKCPVFCMNDANASVLAEHYWGAAVGALDIIFLTMSTGMGAGILSGGHLLQGPRGFAGEIGRIELERFGPAGFGALGTVEGFLSGTGISQLARAHALAGLQRGETTPLLDSSAGPDPSVQAIFAAARRGDVAAMATVDTVSQQLGRLIAMLANIFEPGVVVLGTIGQAHPDVLIPAAWAVACQHIHPNLVNSLKIVPSTIEHRGHVAALAAARQGLYGQPVSL